MIAVGWGAMGSTDLTQLLSVLVIAQWCEARGQTRKDRGSNPRKVELSTHEWNTESGQHSVDQTPSTYLHLTLCNYTLSCFVAGQICRKFTHFPSVKFS